MNSRDPISLDTAERMLSFVRGVDDRDVWVKMAYILKEEFGEAAFIVWDQWSQGAANYVARDARDVWKSCRPSSGSARVTVGTLIALAKEGGWRPTDLDRKPVDPEEVRQREEERRARLEAERIQAQAEREECAAQAADMWARALEPEAHPYLERKQITAHGARVLDGELLIPLRHGPGALIGLQRIRADGTKLFLKGTPAGGAYTVIGKPSRTGTVAIAEGFATAASIHMATGYCVVVALNAGNLVPVAKKIRAAMPNATIVLAADDDAFTDGNPGVTAANAAAREVGGTVAVPIWLDERGRGTDFNDLHLAEGLDAVRMCFENPLDPGDNRGTVKAASDRLAESANNPASRADIGSPSGSGASVPATRAPGGSGPSPGAARDDLGAPDADDRMIFSATPMKTAELFHSTLPEGGRIIHWRGEFYSWDGTRYAIRDRVYVEQRLYHFMASCVTIKEDRNGGREVVAYNPKTSTVNDVAHALRAVCYTNLPEPQVWIDEREGDYPAHEIIAFRNGFLHHPTRTILPSTDRLFVTNALDFDYDPNASEPVEWMQFLHSLWPDDPESIEALAEMFGYLLTDDTSQQKMFMLIGPPRCGKGTILRVLEALVGYHNRVSPSLASLGTQFGLQPLIGKRLAMISDARLSGRADQQPIVENLLRISGEDALSIDRKNIAAWTGKLPTRFVLASNELPAFSDASAALANRFLPFRFNKSFLGREDHGLTSRLLRELPGIVLWALDGLQRLQSRGYLQRPKSADEIAADLVDQTSPIRSFVEDCCLVGEGYQCDRDDLFRAWRKWCEDQGRDHAGTKVSFGRHLSAAFPGIRRTQPRASGTRLNLYYGVRLAPVGGNDDLPY